MSSESAGGIPGSYPVQPYGEVVAQTGEYRRPAHGILGACLHYKPTADEQSRH